MFLLLLQISNPNPNGSVWEEKIQLPILRSRVVGVTLEIPESNSTQTVSRFNVIACVFEGMESENKNVF